MRCVIRHAHEARRLQSKHSGRSVEADVATGRRRRRPLRADVTGLTVLDPRPTRLIHSLGGDSVRKVAYQWGRGVG